MMAGRKEGGKSRRDSMAPFAGISGRLKDMLNAEGDDGQGADLATRLEALENATGRIEEMLGKLCGGLDDDRSKSSSILEVGTGTLADLDKSGTADLDD